MDSHGRIGRCTGGLRTVLLSAIMLSLVVALAGCGAGEKEALPTRVTIDSAPEQGASVLIEGIDRGVTPVVVEGLKPGWTNVLLKKEDYKVTADRIEIREGVEDHFVIEMEALVGFLTLETEPVGATVYCDGARVGRTPFIRKPLRIGEHTYELRLEDYYPVSETLDVKEDYQYEKTYRLKPMEAILSVLSRPTGAKIWINNEAQIEKTPAKFKLPPGLYLVGVHTTGFVQQEARAELAANEKRSVTLKMKQGLVPQGMVLVPAGEFIWGEDGRAPDESPKRKKALDAFYIDKYEVTNEQFQHVFPQHPFNKGQEQFPAAGVSWSQATQYAQAVGKRLPTEAEWEKAARGSDGREYPWGQEFDSKLANTAEKDLGGPVPVGRYLGGASPYACMDMAGNVFEWTQDWYEAYPGNHKITKDYGQVYRVLRGGSFRSPRFEVRCARRHFDRMDAVRGDYGFRCAMDVRGEGESARSP